MKFIEKAQNDKRVVRLKKRLTEGGFFLDLDALEQEASVLHSSRKLRTLKTEDLIASFQKRFISAALQNQAFRSRIVEIKVKCFKTAAHLKENLDHLKPYLRVKYSKLLSEYKTVADKNSAIDSVLEEPIRYLAKLENVDKILENYIKDIDQASWTLKSLIDAMGFNKDKEIKF